MTISALENDFSILNPSKVSVQQGANDELKQNDFIELLVAQVKHQDPTKPMDPSQFMNQLAQFSTVNGIQELKNAFDDLAVNLSSNQTMQAAGLVGRNVLVPGGDGLLTAGGSISGQAVLPAQANDITLKVFNAQGVQVREMPLGTHQAGEMQFKWDGFDDAGDAVSEGFYAIRVEALIGGARESMEVSVEKRIDSINLNSDGSGTLLNLAGGQTVPLGFVQQIK